MLTAGLTVQLDTGTRQKRPLMTNRPINRCALRRGGTRLVAALCTTSIAAVVGLGGCGGKSTSDRTLVFVDPPHAEELLEQRKLLGLGREVSGVFVDPRDDLSFEQSHIPGSISLPFQRVSTEHESLNKYDLVIVYGTNYNDPIAEAMSKRLIELGHRDVRTLRGGLEAWTAVGYDVEP